MIVQIIDRTVLPGELKLLALGSSMELVDAIARLAVREAALGAAGALGVVIVATRPNERMGRGAAGSGTGRVRVGAVNGGQPARGGDRGHGRLPEGRDAVLKELS